MTGRAAPTEVELRANLHKRMYLLEHGPASRNAKRFNRESVTSADAVTAAIGTGSDKATANVAVASGSGSVVGDSAAA